MTSDTVLLSSLLREAPLRETRGSCGISAISAVFCDSREAERHGESGLFVCISGAVFDGHDFAASVYGAGCRCFAVSHPLDLPADALQLIYDDTRVALAELSAAFYGHPARSLSVVGVTGTKGKTSTCLIAYALLSAAGIPTGYIGTSGIRYGNHISESANTTPESLILQRTMREMADSGVRVLVMEVSSQALMQHRVHGIPFHTALFTNLSPDHIGPLEHPSFDAYRNEKRKLFTDFGARHILLNADDPSAPQMLPNGRTEGVETFSAEPECARDPRLPLPTLTAEAMQPKILQDGRPGLSFLLRASDGLHTEVFLPLPGNCNTHNALSALMICKTLGLPVSESAHALASVSVPGRCESVPTQNAVRVLIDYAHNEASLREILTALRLYDPKRLIVLFGSVGGRTKNRRKPMGAVASELADFCILTSDNPDHEPPEEILQEIREGFTRDCPAVIIPDRRDAIAYGLSLAEAGDILLLAGKGHETYQLVAGKKLPYSDRETVEALLRRKANTLI